VESDKRQHGRPFYVSREVSLPAVGLIIVLVLALALSGMFVWVHMDRQITALTLENSRLNAENIKLKALVEHLLKTAP